MYADLSRDIKNDDFMTAKIRPLIDLANQFPVDSASQKMFMNGIEKEIAVHIESIANQLKKIEERRDTVVKSVIASKERMQAYIDTVIVKGIEHIGQTLQNNNPQLDFKGESLQLEPSKQIFVNEPLKIDYQKK